MGRVQSSSAKCSVMSEINKSKYTYSSVQSARIPEACCMPDRRLAWLFLGWLGSRVEAAGLSTESAFPIAS